MKMFLGGANHLCEVEEGQNQTQFCSHAMDKLLAAPVDGEQFWEFNFTMPDRPDEIMKVPSGCGLSLPWANYFPKKMLAEDQFVSGL